MTPTRIIVIGAGQFGQNHIRIVRESPDATLSAIIDPDPTRAIPNIPHYPTLADLPPNTAEAAIIAAPTALHAQLGIQAMSQGLDVLIEKPIAPTLTEADQLIAAAARHNRILQVGHLERYNSAVIALEAAATIPLFFEIHRMSVFSPRSLDTDVVLDLMIHDLDIVLALTRSPIEAIQAAGVQILSPKTDIANVRLQFQDGCIANLTASRVSTEKIRKLRLFQPHQYLSLDYARQDLAAFTVGADQQISFHQHATEKTEPLQAQFAAFLQSIHTRQTPKLSGEIARRTLALALDITAKIEQHAALVTRTLQSK
jgi:predicted dehydrogenase